MSRPPSTLVCSGCGAQVGLDEPLRFRCPRAGEGDVDHVLVRHLDGSAVRWPSGAGEENPFLRYRALLRSQHLALSGPVGDDGYREIVERLDAAVARVDGRGFRATPFARQDELGERLGFSGRGGLWVKDETGNVSGSHKARHLMGVALQIEVAAAMGLGVSGRLAIASCGNAALAAAVVARAGARALDVFVPEDADPAVIGRLRALGADIQVCPRVPGEPGDPTYNRLKEAIAGGAVPFTCQGNQNGLVIEGGETLGWEIVDALGGQELDRVVVQVGGGALASAVLQSLREAVDLGALARMPRVDTVQTESAYPLRRAADGVAARVAQGSPPERAVRYAATHRSEFMRPWETAPHSVAHGILDDETYDWVAVLAGMLATGGRAEVVGEDLLEAANRVGRECTGIDADHTGTAGLAGLMAMLRSGAASPDERVAVLFTGVRRS